MNNDLFKSDSDPQETQEWLESIQSVIENEGIERAHYLLEKLIAYGRRNGIRMPF